MKKLAVMSLQASKHANNYLEERCCGLQYRSLVAGRKLQHQDSPGSPCDKQLQTVKPLIGVVYADRNHDFPKSGHCIGF